MYALICCGFFICMGKYCYNGVEVEPYLQQVHSGGPHDLVYCAVHCKGSRICEVDKGAEYAVTGMNSGV